MITAGWIVGFSFFLRMHKIAGESGEPREFMVLSRTGQGTPCFLGLPMTGAKCPASDMNEQIVL